MARSSGVILPSSSITSRSAFSALSDRIASVDESNSSCPVFWQPVNRRMPPPQRVAGNIRIGAELALRSLATAAPGHPPELHPADGRRISSSASLAANLAEGCLVVAERLLLRVEGRIKLAASLNQPGLRLVQPGGSGGRLKPRQCPFQPLLECWITLPFTKGADPGFNIDARGEYRPYQVPGPSRLGEFNQQQ